MAIASAAVESPIRAHYDARRHAVRGAVTESRQPPARQRGSLLLLSSFFLLSLFVYPPLSSTGIRHHVKNRLVSV